jgi:putative transposase
VPARIPARSGNVPALGAARRRRARDAQAPGQAAAQLPLPLGSGRGGKRAGAGRKPRFERAGVPHVTRPAHDARHPLHITVRVRQGLPSLRGQSLFQGIRAQIRAAKGRYIRVVHFSVQSNHVHLLVEAHDRRVLARGMKGFAVRVARHVNGLLSSRGNVWADRYHARPLRTPREVRNALVYVLFNHRKRGGRAGNDPCSSIMFLEEWANAGASGDERAPPVEERQPVEAARTWLMSRGWKRLGPLDTKARPTPGAANRTRPRARA